MILFTNPGLIDLEAALLMGVNAKTDSAKAIGFFGTGLKFSIATFLRYGCTVTIHRGMDMYRFITKPVQTRGKTFEAVYLEDASGKSERLGFTTDLGKIWEPWQAYRELYSNAKDEEGHTFKADEGIYGKYMTEVGDQEITTIVVYGAAVDEAHAKVKEFILEGEPDIDTKTAQIFKRPCIGVFHKGMLVKKFERTMQFTFNVKTHVTLTEDRTAQYDFHLWDPINKAMDELADRGEDDMVERFLCPGPGTPELLVAHNQDMWNGKTRSAGFSRIMSRLMKTRETEIAPSAKEALTYYKKVVGETMPVTTQESTQFQNMMLDRAVDVCEKMGFPVTKYPILVAERLGGMVLGLAKDGKIYITSACFDLGTKQIVATLIEEYIHLCFLFRDETRGMQDFLLQRMVTIAEEHIIKGPI